MEKSRVEKRYEEIKKTAADGGYTLNPVREFCLRLVEGILVNKDRYGIEACPCRLYMGKQEDNIDIVCPCDYRDDDLAEYGACFCALYITDDYNSKKQVPERRSPKKEDRKAKPADGTSATSLAYPVWRCNVCGYLCANNNPPAKCPVCKAQKERFERFM
ncbi:hypothetical protein LJC56_02240 [Christensenellaceae bacterium OttesenSCG-928-K19]|nr:hypothetical protein [Christensenellaceae bacterium OttesenSCG-928-K19]